MGVLTEAGRWHNTIKQHSTEGRALRVDVCRVWARAGVGVSPAKPATRVAPCKMSWHAKSAALRRLKQQHLLSLWSRALKVALPGRAVKCRQTKWGTTLRGRLSGWEQLVFVLGEMRWKEGEKKTIKLKWMKHTHTHTHTHTYRHKKKITQVSCGDAEM